MVRGLRGRAQQPAHVLRPTINKLAGGAHELAEALVRPGIEIIAGVDRKLAGFAEGWAGTDAGILCEGGLRARDAMVFTNVAGRFCPPHVQWRPRFHIRTPVMVRNRRSMMRAYPVPVIWKRLSWLTRGSSSAFRFA